MIEQTSTPEEGNRWSRAVPEVFRGECVGVLMGRVTGKSLRVPGKVMDVEVSHDDVVITGVEE